MSSAGEYRGGPRGPERISGHRAPVAPPQPQPQRTPAEISMVQEIVEAVALQAFSQSRTSMRKETRPLKWSIAAILGALASGGLWLNDKFDDWQEAQRAQWATESEQAEQADAIAAHLAEPHVSPEQVTALQSQLAGVAAQLAAFQAMQSPKIANPKKGR